MYFECPPSKFFFVNISFSLRRSSFKFASLKYFMPKKIKDVDDNNSGTPDSELDSGKTFKNIEIMVIIMTICCMIFLRFFFLITGISINGHYEDIRSGKNGRLDFDRIDEIKTMTGKYV